MIHVETMGHITIRDILLLFVLFWLKLPNYQVRDSCYLTRDIQHRQYLLSSDANDVYFGLCSEHTVITSPQYAG